MNSIQLMMMLEKIQLYSSAVDDLQHIGQYTQDRWGRQQRNRYLEELDVGFNTIALDPKIGVPCDYVPKGYRKFPINRHTIYSLYTHDRVKIIRVLHHRMDVDSHRQ